MLSAEFWTNIDNKDLRMAMVPHRTLPFAGFFKMVKENEPLFIRHPKPARAAITNNVTSEIDQLRNQMEELKVANENFKKRPKYNNQMNPNIIRSNTCGDTGNMMRNCQRRSKTRSGKQKEYTLTCRKNSKSPTIESH